VERVVQSFQSMVKTVFLKRFEISKLHSAHITSKQLVCWKPGTVVLFTVFEECRSVAVALPTLVAAEGLVLGGLWSVAARDLARVL